MNDDNIFGLIKNRDIIFFDVETTGVNIKNDRIVELSATKYTKQGTKDIIHYYIKPGDIIIPDDAIAIHGITNEFIQDKPLFGDICDDLYVFFKGCDLGGYNIVKLDIPILFEEFTRCNKVLNVFGINIYDSFNLLNKYESRKLSDVYQRFFDKGFDNVHTASSDVDACIEVFNEQINRYDLLDESGDFISNKVRSNDKGEKFLDFDSWFLLKDGEIFLNKGEYRGNMAKDHLDFLYWVSTNNKIQNNVRFVANELIKKYKK